MVIALFAAALAALAPQPREFSGVWLNRFEGSSFHEGARDLKAARDDRQSIWLSMTDEAAAAPGFHPLPNHAYRLRFTGRAARDMKARPPFGYGHMGMSAGLVVVDQVAEAVDLGPIGGR